MTRERILAMLSTGASQAAVARALGVSHQYVNQVVNPRVARLRKRNWHRRRVGTGRVYSCRACGEPGHNSRSCARPSAVEARS